MDKYFICLANSYKRGGRCIAGIEITYKNSKEWSVVRNNDGTPRWIRPIAHTTFGEIPTITAQRIHYFSIVKLFDVSSCPKTLHMEDVFYSRLEVCETLKPTTNILDEFIDATHNIIFFNKGRAVAADSTVFGAYSLMLIKPESITVFTDNSWVKPKTRMKILYCGTTYDFPVTDPVFLDEYRANPNLLQSNKNVYLTLSLGLEFEGWHHKLVAAVFRDIPEASHIVATKWTVKEERPFTEEEIDAVLNSVVEANQYGKSICFYMKAGGQSYIPLTHDSNIGVGEAINIQDCVLVTLCRNGDNDILRVRYNEKMAKPSYMEQQKQIHTNAYNRWSDDDDKRLLQLQSEERSIKELMEIFGRNEGAIVSRLKKLEASNTTQTDTVVDKTPSKSIITIIRNFFKK